MGLMNNKYTVDSTDNEIIIDKNNFQVMMKWEKPYMQKLVERLNPSGDVLEIGFGLGYSAAEIQKYDIKSHTIIEADKEGIARLKEWAKHQPHQVNIVEGTWQNVLHTLGEFDCIFFDDSPHEDHPDDGNIGLYIFYYRVLKNHAKNNTRLVWYCDKPIFWLSHTFTEWSCLPLEMEIPESCHYISKNVKENKILFLPLVTFPYGCVIVENEIAFDRFLQFVDVKNKTTVTVSLM
jgi:hypothetical protein